MPKTKPLPSKRLRAHIAAEKIPFSGSEEIRVKNPVMPQPRALQALELSLHFPDLEHNVYVSGEPGLGRTHFVTEFLTPQARRIQTPPDLLYVNNFEEPDRPTLVTLPACEGGRFHTALKRIIATLRKDIPALFEHEVYLKKRENLVKKYNSSREKLLFHMEKQASSRGFNVSIDDHGGLALYPLVEGKVLSSDEYDNLTPEFRQEIKSRSNLLMDSVLETLRRIDREETELEKKKRSLDMEETAKVLDRYFAPLIRDFAAHEQLVRFLGRIKKDILDNLEEFMPQEHDLRGVREPFSHPDDFFVRYRTNLFVDNSRSNGAPVIVEDNPTFYNLLGSIQRETEMGTLHTNFSLLRPGSLHKANNGFLIVNAEQLLMNPTAWEGLLRCLRSGCIKMEDPDSTHEGIKTKTLEPEIVPLQVRIILVGTDLTYELLLENDDRFEKYFKLKAHLQEWVQRNSRTLRRYLGLLAAIIRREGLPPFDRSALAELVNYSSRLVQDQEKLSLRFPHLREIMMEAGALAGMQNESSVRDVDVRKAVANREFRSNLYEEEFLHEYDREAIRVPTSGVRIGQAIGLSVSQFGDYVMALPHLISCTVGVGHGGILDLEREAELGGPIHTKGMMILKSYFMELFAQDKPLTFTGSLCFEQSYAHVDGDSASGAELAALLSALSAIPVNLSLAFTGAVSQSGAVLAVGEVSRKIEGFFEVCRRRRLTGKQGVLIPADNMPHLMLKEEVVQAVEDGSFSIYPVRTIEEAMELLTDVPAGRRLKRGGYSSGSLFRAVDERLAELAYLAEQESKCRKPGRKSQR
ncbi:MAG: Lon protease family protein, partial [Desulfovibrionales bacterium]